MSSPCHANIYVKQQHLSTWAHALRDGRIMGRDWTYLPPWPTSCPPSPGPGQGTAHAHLPLRDSVIESSKHDVYFVSASERQRQWDWRRRSLEDKKKDREEEEHQSHHLTLSSIFAYFSTNRQSKHWQSGRIFSLEQRLFAANYFLSAFIECFYSNVSRQKYWIKCLGFFTFLLNKRLQSFRVVFKMYLSFLLDWSLLNPLWRLQFIS